MYIYIYMCIYIYIYKYGEREGERERERDLYVCTAHLISAQGHDAAAQVPGHAASGGEIPPPGLQLKSSSKDSI